MGARGKNFYNDLVCQYGFEKEAKEIQDLYLSGNKRDAEKVVPLELLELGNLVGPASYVKERIAAFAEAGVTDLQVLPVSDDPAGHGASAQGDGRLRLHRRDRFANLDRIARLDPETDADEILALTSRHDFPWDYQQGTGIAFMRDYGIPSIAALLDRTGEFEHHGVKRYDDTLLVGDQATIDGIDSPRSHADPAPAQPHPRPLRDPRARVPLRPRHHDRRPGRVDPGVRLARPAPPRAGRDRADHHQVR